MSVSFPGLAAPSSPAHPGPDFTAGISVAAPAKAQVDTAHVLDTGRGGARLLWSALQPYRRKIIAGIGVGITWSLVKLSMPVLVRDAVDHGIGPNDLHHLIIVVGSMLALGEAAALLAGLRRYFAISAAFQVEAFLRAALFRHLLQLDAAQHAKVPAGQVVSRATSDLQQIQQPFVNIPLTASNTVMFLGASTILVAIDPLLAFCAMGPILTLFFLARRFNAALGPRATDLQHSTARFAGRAADAIAGIRAIKGLGLEPSEIDRAHKEAADVYDAAIAVTRVRAAYLPLIEVLPAVGIVAVLWIGSQHVVAGRLTIGELTQFNYYVLMLIGPLRHTGMTLAQFQRAFVSAGLIDKLFAARPTVADGAGIVSASVQSGLERGLGGTIRFENVEFAHGDSPPLLRGLDFTIAPGETVAIVGMAGSGKTSLAGLIPRLHDVSGGRVLIDGCDVREAPLSQLRGAIGMVFEDPFLFSGSVRENISFARPDALDAEVEAAARAAGAHDFIIALEGAYEAKIGERGFSLSGGQRQRIALARALLTDPRILVLDAATSAVDAAKEEEIREALSGVIGRRTTVMIAHRPSTLRLADRVLVLDRGYIVASGQHDELLRSSADYRRVLSLAAPATMEEGA